MRHAIHSITVATVTGSTRDAEGRTTPTLVRSTVRGFASLLSDPETFLADQRSRTIAVAVDVPLKTQVFSKDELDVAGTGEFLLDGHYQVVEIRPNRVAKRLLCQRYEV